MGNRKRDNGGVLCPACGLGTRVTDSRQCTDGSIRRRRFCQNKHRFTTYEVMASRYTQVAGVADLLVHAEALAATAGDIAERIRIFSQVTESVTKMQIGRRTQ